MSTGSAHGLEDGYHIRTAQELLGRKDLKTTMVYTDVLNRGGQPKRELGIKRRVSEIASQDDGRRR